MHLLAYFRDLVRRDAGYELRRVRGWATAQKVEEATAAYPMGEPLQRAFRRGDLLCENVSAPSGPRPVWVFRITDETARKMAALEGSTHDPLQPCASETEQYVLMRCGVVAAMDAMRDALKASSRRARIKGEPEWRTARELSLWLADESERLGIVRHCQSDDLLWAISHGLVERRRIPPHDNSPPQGRDVLVYRLTSIGAGVKPLVWHNPNDE